MKFSEQLHQQAAAIEQAAKAIEAIESAMPVMAGALAAFLPPKEKGIDAYLPKKPRPETMRESQNEGGIAGSGVSEWDPSKAAA